MRDSIIYIYPSNASFVRKDIDFLSKKYKVLAPKYNWTEKSKLPFLLLKQFFFLLVKSRKTKAIVIMFGGYWSFLPTLMGKLLNTKTYIILGGTDCVSFPKLNYGSLRKPILSKAIYWSYKWADKLLPVDESLIEKNYSYWEESTFKKQGYKAFFKNLNTQNKVIPNGFDTELFSESKAKKKNNSFITVAKINSDKTFQLKGIDKLFFLAKEFPNCNFTVIGVDREKVNLTEVPQNIKLLPFMLATEFVSYLHIHQFVIQLSISEGFPNALCEAMLCNCIPVVSNVGAMPGIIKESGFIMNSSKEDNLKKRFKAILNTTDKERNLLSKEARKIVVENYPISKREQLLLQEIEA